MPRQLSGDPSRLATLGWRPQALFTRIFAFQVACSCLMPLAVRSGDVVGYSILKGQFLNQLDSDVLATDPTFGFSILASVNLADWDLLVDATLDLPNGQTVPLDNLGESWDYLDSHATFPALNTEYGWGEYTLEFETANDGSEPFTCQLSFSEAELPPTPRLANFADVQMVDPGKPLILTWEFEGQPLTNDFVQVYVNLGHGEVFWTPDLDELDALNGVSRSVTIPADTLVAGYVHSLNLEITRIVSTNSQSYPFAQGVTGTFSSTSVDVFVVTPPALQIMTRTGDDPLAVQVVVDPGQSVVFESSEDLKTWTELATGAAASGTNEFNLPLTAGRRFFRAWQQ